MFEIKAKEPKDSEASHKFSKSYESDDSASHFWQCYTLTLASIDK